MNWYQARDWMRANPGESLTAQGTPCEWRYSEAGYGYQVRIGGTWQRSSDFLGSGPSYGSEDYDYAPLAAVREVA